MRKYWRPISVLCAIFLQGALIPALFKSTVGPNLFLTLTLVITLVNGRRDGLISAAILGMYQDLLVGQYVGLNMAIMMILVLILSYSEQFLFKNSLVTSFVTIAFATILKEILFLLIVYATGFKMTFSFAIVEKILIMSVLNAIIGTLLYRVVYLGKKDIYDRSINF